MSMMSALFVGCASQIGLRQDVNLDTFVFGKTTKADVVSTFGLPQKIESDIRGEHYFYEKSAHLLSIMSANRNGVARTNMRAADEASSSEDRVEFVFDAQGLLIDGY
jgi:hypothetical protein